MTRPGLSSFRRVFIYALMNRETHDRFYKSKAWKKCRAAYIAEQGGLCERCLAKGLISPAEIVHHKEYLTEITVNDPEKSLNFKNLEALCMKCHNNEHFGAVKIGKRYEFKGGRIVY